jgi:hypothetical protein
MRNKLATLLNTYWRSGILGVLVFIDLVIFTVCLTDILRFSLKGLSFTQAFRVTLQLANQDHKLPLLALAVFVFFIIGMPIAAAFVCVFFPSERWPKWLGSKSVSVLLTHFSFSILIACFSSIAVVMEVLSGWSIEVDAGSTHHSEYSFVSNWLFAVFFGKFISVAYLSPIFKKLFWRASVERHGKMHGIALETVKEVITEHSLHEGH